MVKPSPSNAEGAGWIPAWEVKIPQASWPKHKTEANTVCVWFFRFQSSVSGHISGFHVLATINSAAMNSSIHVPLQIIVFSGYILRNKTAGSDTNSTDF